MNPTTAIVVGTNFSVCVDLTILVFKTEMAVSPEH